MYDSRMDRNELLWRVYEDNRTFARFHENQRATVTALVVGGNAALIAAMIGGDGLEISDVPFSAMTVLISLLGLVISLKSTEKLRRHNKRASRFLKLIEVSSEKEPLDLAAIKHEVDAAIDAAHWFASRFRQSTLWVGIHIISLCVSVSVLSIILFRFYTG